MEDVCAVYVVCVASLHMPGVGSEAEIAKQAFLGLKMGMKGSNSSGKSDV